MTDTASTEFTGKTVLITGGSRGMGEQMAHAFAARGANIVVASRKVENCRSVADDLVRKPGVRALPVGFNASSRDACARLVEEASPEFGRVALLITIAVMSPPSPSPPRATQD